MSICLFSHFQCASDKHPKKRELLWEDFQKYICAPHHPVVHPHCEDAKKYMPAWSPTVFKENASRAVENAISLGFLVLDYDNAQSVPSGEKPTGAREKMKKVVIPNPVTMPEVEAILAPKGVKHILHPTYSNTPSWPHFRLIVPLPQAIPAAKWEQASHWLLERLALNPTLRGVDLPVLKDVARIYFLPKGDA